MKRNLSWKGGVLVAIGSSAPEGPFDYDDDPSTTFAFKLAVNIIRTYGALG